MSAILDVTSPSSHHHEFGDGQSGDIHLAPTDEGLDVVIRFDNRRYDNPGILVCQVLLQDSMRVPITSAEFRSDMGDQQKSATDAAARNFLIPLSPQQKISMKTAEVVFLLLSHDE